MTFEGLDPVVLDLVDLEQQRAELDGVAAHGAAAEIGEDDSADGVLVPVGELDLKGLLDLFDQHGAGDGVDVVAEGGQLRFLGVELVLDLADDLLDHVLQRDHAAHPAVLVEDGRQVDLLGEHAVEQPVEGQGLRHEGEVPGHALERFEGLGAAEQVLDVDHADDPVERAVAQGEAGVAALPRDLEVGLERLLGVEIDHVGPRHHDLPRHAVGELEDVVQQLALAFRQAGRVPRGEQAAQLLLVLGQLPFGHRLDADHLEDRVGAVVEHPDRRVGRLVEALHGHGNPQGGVLGLADGERLRRQLAEHDVQNRDGHERHGQRHGVDQARPGAGDQADHRLDDPDERRFADPAQGQARQGDAELGGREVGVQVLDHVPGDPPAPQARRGVGVELGRPHLDQGELGGDEEAVEEDQAEGEDQAEHGDRAPAPRRAGAAARTNSGIMTWTAGVGPGRGPVRPVKVPRGGPLGEPTGGGTGG